MVMANLDVLSLEVFEATCYFEGLAHDIEVREDRTPQSSANLEWFH